jgi:hypothetical protein
VSCARARKRVYHARTYFEHTKYHSPRFQTALGGDRLAYARGKLVQCPVHPIRNAHWCRARLLAHPVDLVINWFNTVVYLIDARKRVIVAVFGFTLLVQLH